MQTSEHVLIRKFLMLRYRYVCVRFFLGGGGLVGLHYVYATIASFCSSAIGGAWSVGDDVPDVPLPFE